jgi:hypothetical protein
MKEPLIAFEKNVSFIVLNQKQLRPAIDFSINTILAKQKNGVILLSFSENSGEIIRKINKNYVEKLVIIDACSKETLSSTKNVIYVNNPSDLTSIQIAIEKAQKILVGEKTIIIDALNVLSIYNNKKVLGKFLHLFGNKTKLCENSAIIFTVKESTDKEILSLVKEFSDKSYDYADLFVSAIALAES